MPRLQILMAAHLAVSAYFSYWDIVYEDPYYAVQIGEYNTLDEAVRLENELKKKGYDTLVI